MSETKTTKETKKVNAKAAKVTKETKTVETKKVEKKENAKKVAMTVPAMKKCGNCLFRMVVRQEVKQKVIP